MSLYLVLNYTGYFFSLVMQFAARGVTQRSSSAGIWPDMSESPICCQKEEGIICCIGTPKFVTICFSAILMAITQICASILAYLSSFDLPPW